MAPDGRDDRDATPSQKRPPDRSRDDFQAPASDPRDRSYTPGPRPDQGPWPRTEGTTGTPRHPKSGHPTGAGTTSRRQRRIPETGRTPPRPQARSRPVAPDGGDDGVAATAQRRPPGRGRDGFWAPVPGLGPVPWGPGPGPATAPEPRAGGTAAPPPRRSGGRPPRGEGRCPARAVPLYAPSGLPGPLAPERPVARAPEPGPGRAWPGTPAPAPRHPASAWPEVGVPGPAVPEGRTPPAPRQA